MLSLEHIDPRESDFICGLDFSPNLIWVDNTYNARKTNRFVPYRVCDYNAPTTFGDLGEFLIGTEWKICEFGGEIWWEESNRLGNSCVKGGRTQGQLCVELEKGMFNPDYKDSSKYIEDRRKIGQRRVAEKTGIFDPAYVNSPKYREDRVKAGRAGSREDKVAAGKKAGAVTSKLISKPIAIVFPNGLRKDYESSVSAAKNLNVNPLTLRRLAESGKIGVKQKYRGWKVFYV